MMRAVVAVRQEFGHSARLSRLRRALAQRARRGVQYEFLADHLDCVVATSAPPHRQQVAVAVRIASIGGVAE